MSSFFQQKREGYVPELPSIFSSREFPSFIPLATRQCDRRIQTLFPHSSSLNSLWEAKQGPVSESGRTIKKQPFSVALLFSGGPAPGGHNVVTGLFDALERIDPLCKLYGFRGGPSSLIEGDYEQLSATRIAPYRNQGGFDLLGSGRTKIESEEQMQKAAHHLLHLKIDALVIVGGDDSNTNAALLAEYFMRQGHPISVIGIPKTIDGDLTTPEVPVSFGFDTACRVYSEMIGNLQRDALSARKYTHFVKLMGRSASHIALECALHCQPNALLIGEELRAQKSSLVSIVQSLADLIEKRAASKRSYGVVLIPEGLIEFLPEMDRLLQGLSKVSASDPEKAAASLDPSLKESYLNLPARVQQQLLQDRDSHGNLNLSRIETDRLLVEMVKSELKRRSSSCKFDPICHFFGYEGRSAYPSHFDTHYTYALGWTAAYLIGAGIGSCMAALFNPEAAIANWRVGAVPLTPLLTLEERKGKEKPVIRKTLVDLKGPLFQRLNQQRPLWAKEDLYLYPGPIQFGPQLEWRQQLPLILQEKSGGDQ